jgi:hypothetical protein
MRLTSDCFKQLMGDGLRIKWLHIALADVFKSEIGESLCTGPIHPHLVTHCRRNLSHHAQGTIAGTATQQ